MKARKLHIAEGLALPLDTVTDTIGILAVKGAGKTFTFLVLVEEMIRAGLPVVVIDPVGVCWGLRASADGESKGLPVVILGGSHADAPLEPSAGKVIADFAIAERRPVVLDLSAFETKVDALRFATDFLTRLYQKNKLPLHVVIDEADELAPQKPFGEETRALRALEVLVRRGRARGLGCTLVTQRAAVINKNVLTQISTLILGRTGSPQDRKAVEAWVDVHGTDEQRKELMASLASLPTREKWIWSPGRDVFQRVTIRARETFDSSATPKVGAVVVEPKELAPVDLAALRTAIASTVEKAKGDDPKVLRSRIAEQAAQIADLEAKLAAAETRGDDHAETEALRQVVASANAAGVVAGEAFEKMLAVLRGAAMLPAAPARVVAPPTRREGRVAVDHGVYPSARAARATAPAPPGGKLAGGERKILSVLAQYPAGRSKTQVAILTGYASTGGGFGNYLSALRTRGLLAGGNDLMKITNDGLVELGPFERLPTGRALLEHWMGTLGKAERAALEALAAVYPSALTRAQIADATAYEANGGGFGNALSKLRTLELITGRAEMKASDVFFEGRR